MGSNTITRVVILGALSIIGILAIQSYWVLKTWDLKEQEFQQSVNIALLKVAESLVDVSEGELPTLDIITQVSSNYYVVNIENVIDANLLEYYLQKEFERVALDVPFEYGIHDCSSNKMVYGSYCNNSEVDRKEDVELGILPKYDKFTYYFGIKFPTRSSHLMESMRLSILFSIVLFFAILFFMYSIFVILRQKRLSEMQKDFINNMTHEFKTPISTIKISADVFLNNPSIQNDPRLHQYANIIKEQNERLNSQVEKVLQLAKIERNSFQLNLEPVNLHEIMNRVMHSVELNVTKQNGVLESKLNATKTNIQADKLHLTNIIHNLLDNAIKYCKEKPNIKIETKEEGNRIKLSIIDQGIGIAKEYQSKVFNKFYRVPTGNVHNVKGFGLGLFYIKNICDAHGWKLELESEANKGTAITLTMNLLDQKK